MSNNYYAAFAEFLKSGNANALQGFMDNPKQAPLLAVYRNGYFKACVDALRANYPITQQLLTDELFNGIARKYVELEPPVKTTLVGYGENFVNFLANPSRKILMSLPTITAEIAQLDAHWLATLNCPVEKHSLTAEMVMALTERDEDPAEKLVSLNNSVHISQLKFNSFEFWHQVKTDGSVPEKFALQRIDQSILFWRSQGHVQARTLSEAEIHFYGALAKKPRILGQVLEETLRKFPQFDIAEQFSNCLTHQLLKTEIKETA